MCMGEWEEGKCVHGTGLTLGSCSSNTPDNMHTHYKHPQLHTYNYTPRRHTCKYILKYSACATFSSKERWTHTTHAHTRNTKHTQSYKDWAWYAKHFFPTAVRAATPTRHLRACGAGLTSGSRSSPPPFRPLGRARRTVRPQQPLAGRFVADAQSHLRQSLTFHTLSYSPSS